MDKPTDAQTEAVYDWAFADGELPPEDVVQLVVWRFVAERDAAEEQVKYLEGRILTLENELDYQIHAGWRGAG